MGFFDFLRPKQIEWTESTLSAVLYPLEGYQHERDGLLNGGRMKHHWATIRVSATPSGKYKGQPFATISVGKTVVGVIRAQDAAKSAAVWPALTQHRVTIGTVRLVGNDGREGGTTAELTLGPHKYQPRREN